MTVINQEFSDFCAQRDAQNTIKLNIVKHCFALCDALRDDYIAYSIKSCKRAISDYEYTYGTSDSVQGNYFVERLEKLKQGICEYDFYVDSSGRKYHKVFMYIDGNRNSIHAFVDKQTGEVYKPASLKSPAKGVRFNLLLIKDREWLLENADWAGGYLYKR